MSTQLIHPAHLSRPYRPLVGQTHFAHAVFSGYAVEHILYTSGWIPLRSNFRLPNFFLIGNITDYAITPYLTALFQEHPGRDLSLMDKIQLTALRHLLTFSFSFILASQLERSPLSRRNCFRAANQHLLGIAVHLVISLVARFVSTSFLASPSLKKSPRIENSFSMVSENGNRPSLTEVVNHPFDENHDNVPTTLNDEKKENYVDDNPINASPTPDSYVNNNEKDFNTDNLDSGLNSLNTSQISFEKLNLDVDDKEDSQPKS